MLQKIKNVVDYARVFPTLGDLQRYRQIAYRGGSQPVEVRVRAAGNTRLTIRPKTSDAAVLWDTFHERFHLPPIKLRPEAVILDLGANVGYTAVHFAQVYPEARVVAVELDKQNYEAARNHTRDYPRCTLINAAVWSEDGTVSYDAGEEAWGFHVESNGNGNGGAARPMTTAQAKTLTTIMADNKISEVDYIKMDIEGAEWPVLSTADGWLERVKSIKVEIHPKFNKDATYENCARILTGRGFECRRDDRHWDTLVGVRR